MTARQDLMFRVLLSVALVAVATAAWLALQVEATGNERDLYRCLWEALVERRAELPCWETWR